MNIPSATIFMVDVPKEELEIIKANPSGGGLDVFRYSTESKYLDRDDFTNCRVIIDDDNDDDDEIGDTVTNTVVPSISQSPPPASLTSFHSSVSSPLSSPPSSPLSSPPPNSRLSRVLLRDTSDNVVSYDGMYAGMDGPNKKKRKRASCGARSLPYGRGEKRRTERLELSYITA